MDSILKTELSEGQNLRENKIVLEHKIQFLCHIRKSSVLVQYPGYHVCHQLTG